MRIAVDAMGGDLAPREIVAGAVEAARAFTDVTKVFLVGEAQAVQAELEKCGPVPPQIEIRNATEVIAMSETPVAAVRRKKDSSINRAIDMIKQGEADGVVSAGNTGALVASATLKLRTLEGVERPAIAAVMPTEDRPFILIDAGANVDCSPRLLAQFAVMGSEFSKKILGQTNPVVGLLNIGGEDTKGNDITKEAFNILSKSSLNFKGNIEGHDLFKGGLDVVVCDGFLGNVVLKTTESTARAVAHWMKQEFTSNPVRMFGTILLKGAIRAMKQKMDPEMYGGAPLLGVNGVCIKAHGSSSRRAILNAIRVSRTWVENKLNDLISKGVRDVVAGEKD